MTALLDYFTRECAKQGLDPLSQVQGSIAHASLIIATDPSQIAQLQAFGWAQVTTHHRGTLESSLTMSEVYHGKKGQSFEDRVICYDLDLSIGIKDKSGSVIFRFFAQRSTVKTVYNRQYARVHPAYARIVTLADSTPLPSPEELIKRTIEAHAEITRG